MTFANYPEATELFQQVWKGCEAELKVFEQQVKWEIRAVCAADIRAIESAPDRRALDSIILHSPSSSALANSVQEQVSRIIWDGVPKASKLIWARWAKSTRKKMRKARRAVWFRDEILVHAITVAGLVLFWTLLIFWIGHLLRYKSSLDALLAIGDEPKWFIPTVAMFFLSYALKVKLHQASLTYRNDHEFFDDTSMLPAKPEKSSGRGGSAGTTMIASGVGRSIGSSIATGSAGPVLLTGAILGAGAAVAGVGRLLSRAFSSEPSEPLDEIKARRLEAAKVRHSELESGLEGLFRQARSKGASQLKSYVEVNYGRHYNLDATIKNTWGIKL